MGWFSKPKPKLFVPTAPPKPVSQPQVEATTTASAPQISAIPETHMSWFTSLVSIEHSTVAWIATELTKIEKDEPKISSVIDTSLTYITPALQIALNATGDPAAAAIVGAVSTQAQKDLTVASALVTDFGPTPTAASAFSAVQANLSALLTAGHVTSATSVAAVTKAVNEVGNLATAVSTAATAISAAASAPAA